MSLSPSLARGSRTIQNVQLTEQEVRSLCLKSREIFLKQPILLELGAPIKICGEWNRWTVVGLARLAYTLKPCRSLSSWFDELSIILYNYCLLSLVEFKSHLAEMLCTWKVQ